MKKVLTQITPRQVTGALHQNEGVMVTTEDGKEYSFVPLTPLLDSGNGDKSCAGTVTLMRNGQFTNYEFGAELFLRRADTADAHVELDILSE